MPSCSVEDELRSMINPIITGALALAVAGLATAASRQFKAYSNGERTYVSVLEGRPFLAFVVILVVGALGSLLISLLTGSLGLFPYIFLGFATVGASVLLWGLSKQRR